MTLFRSQRIIILASLEKQSPQWGSKKYFSTSPNHAFTITMRLKFLPAFFLLLVNHPAHVVAASPYWMEGSQSAAVSKAGADQLILRIDSKDAKAKSWIAHWTNENTSGIWNEEARQLIVKYRVNPLRASRALTLMHVAMQDAYTRADAARFNAAGKKAAMHIAAAHMLSHLFPLETPGRLEALGISALSALANSQPEQADVITHGAAIGHAIARVAIQRALGDGADVTWDARTRPAPTQGLWRATPPLDVSHPQEPLAGEWRTWVLLNGSEIQPPPPPQYGSEAFLAAAKEVLEVNKHLTAEEKRIAEYWHLDQGTVTPPGLWNIKARELSDQNRLSETERVKMFALLNVAMMDASIAGWRAKFTWWTQRPITVIRDSIDAAFLPPLVTPTHPSYVSGHATVSGAAAEVLKSYFPNESTQIDAWADEAAVSRLYGGIHYRFDNEAGLSLGRQVGKRAVAQMKTSDFSTATQKANKTR